MTPIFRFTLYEASKAVADALGLVCDKDSRPDLFEWYLTFTSQNDSLAFLSFLVEPDGRFLPHGFSHWEITD